MLSSIAIFLVAAVIAVPLFKKLGLGSVLGYLTAGVVIGPSVLGLIWEVDSIMRIGEFGVVLLLFLMGLELQPARLWAMRRAVFGVGGIQVLVSAVVLGAIAVQFGLGWQAALVVGMALAVSCTAFAIQALSERGELSKPHGRASFGVLLFQDIASIPVLAILPLMAVTSSEGGVSVGPFFLALGVMAAVIVGGRLVLKPVFRIVANARTRELSVALALLVVIGTSLIMEFAGISMVLGALVGGVLLSDSEYRHELEANIEPFKGLLLGLFFMAVGMSANLRILFEQAGLVLALVAGMVVVKFLVLLVAARAGGLDKRSSVGMAAALSQGGEFAYVIFQSAQGLGVLGAEADVLVMVVTVSMATTPLLFMAYDVWVKRLDARAEKLPYDEISDAGSRVIIAGFGRFGQIVGRVLGLRGIRFTALDISPTHIDFVRKFGNKIHYGDAGKLELLRAAGADRAEVFVLAIDDMETSLRVLEMVRSSFPHLKIVARARNRQHAYALLGAGVEDVIRETFAASVSAARVTLEHVGIPSSEALRTERIFTEYDEEAVRRSAALREDMDALVAAAKDYASELESIFNADAQSDA